MSRLTHGLWSISMDVNRSVEQLARSFQGPTSMNVGYIKPIELFEMAWLILGNVKLCRSLFFFFFWQFKVGFVFTNIFTNSAKSDIKFKVCNGIYFISVLIWFQYCWPHLVQTPITLEHTDLHFRSREKGFVKLWIIFSVPWSRESELAIFLMGLCLEHRRVLGNSEILIRNITLCT